MKDINDLLERHGIDRSHPVIHALTAAELGAVLLPPDRVGLPSSWWGHVPFAHWLVHELNPAVVVELGTLHGVSFSAFCNAVRRYGLATRCYAIDTWQGDEQAGFYHVDVFSSIEAFVKDNYSSFATLVRSTFEAAVELIADGSIDLLHIDGLHTYEAVKADFETWLPKLSQRGVVLFHDTAIYGPTFGVWQFWKEISQRHPSFEFHHSCGLGILAPGNTVPDFIAALVAMDAATAASLRSRLAELGERWIVVDERTRALAEVTALRQRQQQAQATNDRLQQEVSRLRDTLAVQEDEIAAARQQAERLRLELEQIRSSTSWRLMGPYRVAGHLLKRRVLRPMMMSALKRQQMRDFQRISAAGIFNASFYLGRETHPGETDDAIINYLAASRAGIPRIRQRPGVPPRRPILGFHPLVYAAECKVYNEGGGEDPIAHYLRTGMPEGPWKHDVIQPHPSVARTGSDLRLGLHAHIHYPELLEDLMRRLRANTSRADLFITTTSEAKAAEIRATLARHDEPATVVVVPNRGRDIGPLLMQFSEFERYDIVGHVHGKRSPQQGSTQGGNWRNFLWDHLIGGAAPILAPMMDVILDAFAAEAHLGLVFAEDPNLNHWDMNQALALALAERMGLPGPLPDHFEFPKGNMFWARPAALRPLANLGWSWSDFPAEPAASDGTVLHALERLITFAAARAGFGFKTVHVPHSWRLPEQV